MISPSVRTTLLALIFSLLSMFAFSSHGHAQEHDEHAASRLFELGMAAFRAEDFAAAYERFRAAYELYPSNDMLFNMGVSAERIGRFDDAVEHLRRYVEQAPDGHDRADAERRLLVVRARRQAATTPQEPLAPEQANASVPNENAEAIASPLSMTPRETTRAISESTQPVASPLSMMPSETRDTASGSVFGEWWFWTIVGVVVAGSVTAAVLASQSSSSSPPQYAPSDIGVVVFALEAPR